MNGLRSSRRWRGLFAASLFSCAALAMVSIDAVALAGGLADVPKQPTAFESQLLPIDHIGHTRMPEIDRKQVEAEDQARDAEGFAPRYAITNEVNITPETHGTWELLDRTTSVWRLRVSSEDALSINLGFTRYKLPEAAHLFVYAADNSFVIRPFTSADNRDHGQLWTPPVPSDDIIVELTVPNARRHQVELLLGSINLGYRGFYEIGALLSGSCNVDTICAEGDDWRDEIPAIAVISTGGSTFCSGFMVNNIRGDLTPYFMTARHCGITAGNAPSLVVFWNFENSYCRPPGQPGSGGTGDGSLTQFNTGSVHRASYTPSDVTLVELNASPNPEWFISYAGWDATGDDANWAVGIHHPSTNEKRISFQWYPTTTTSYLGNAVPGDGTHARIIDWDLGTTEPGSSGSPLFNQDHRVIGQLHGGYASCTSATSDWYGKFSVSFFGGGTASTSLKPWLDPDDTGILVADTISTRGMTISPGNNVVHLGPVGGPFTDDTYEYTLTNNTSSAVDYEVSLTHNIGILIDGGTAPVSGTLSPGGDTELLTVSLDASVYALPAGIYTEVIVFEDFSTGLTREITHTLEVGTTGFSTSPSLAFMSSGPLGGPFNGTQTYTLTSTKPTPVTITVDSPQSWIAVNGSTSPVQIVLNGIGATEDVEISFSSAADALPNGIHNGNVLFTNDDGGEGDTSRSVVLDVGRFIFHAQDLPQPITDNTTITSTIDVDETFCVGNVEVDIDITHTYIGDLTIDLTSPSGITVRLHDRTGGSADDIVTTYADTPDDGVTVPDGPGMLSDFNLFSVEGTWTITLRDNAGGDQGTFNSWALRVAPVGDNGGACPELETVHYFPMDEDPGWTAQGVWEFGVPTGGSGSSGHPGPTSTPTGQYCYATNLAGGYPNNMPEYHLITTPIDCSGLTSTRLRFWKQLNVESSTWDKSSLSVSNDGSTWTTIYAHGGTVNDADWNQVSYDISAVADNQPTVYLRWTLGPTDGSVTYVGWYIDDVEIIALAPTSSCPEDLDGNGSVSVGDLLVLLSAWGPCASCPEDLDGNGTVNVGDMLILLNAWGDCP